MASPSGSDEHLPSASGIKSESSSVETASPVDTKPASPNADPPVASPQTPSPEETASTDAEETYADAATVLPPEPDLEVSDPAPPSPEQRSSRMVPVEKNVFYNEETLKYMRIIDTYKKLGVAEIELPRLVIAGAQSSGKSSLLENLTGLPVPITKGMGTRFPIEINLIEDPDKFQITSSIIPSRGNRQLSDVDVERMRKVYTKPVTQVEFEDLLREASLVFGVPPPVFAGDQASNTTPSIPASKHISSHTLQIEMRGPDFKSLSFVDTPGLFQSGNKDHDAKSVEEIENLVEDLVAEKRTIIVAVMDATQETIHQKIFSFVDDVDPAGERTIGVMTKCDLVPTPEKDVDAYESTIKRAKNQERVLKHGWYMVKNRLASETRANVSLEAAREKEGRLFTEKEWTPSDTGLDPSRMGIDGLRRGLSSVFCSHIRTEFPAFNEQTRLKLGSMRARLNSLGKPRGTLSEQRIYLKSVASAYQLPKHECLSNDLPFSASGALLVKLASLKRLNFRDRLDVGTVWQFQTPKSGKDSDSDQAACETDDSTGNIYTWINNRYQLTRSRFFPGLIPYPLLKQLFEEQTASWAVITDVFVKSVRMEFSTAVTSCLQCACQNKQVFDELQKLIISAVEAKLGTLMDFCLDLIKDEQNGLQVVSSENQFLTDIREARTLRLMSAISRLEDESLDTKTPSILGGGLFGELGSGSRPTTGGLFGNTTSGGSSSASKPTSGGLFGGSTPGGLGSAGSSFRGTATDGIGSTSTTPTTSGLFGSSISSSSTTTMPTTSSGLFGGTSSSTTRKPATSSGLFGSTSSNATTTNPVDSGPTTRPTSGFGGGFGSSQNTGLGGWGDAATGTAGFGATNTTTGAFGASRPNNSEVKSAFPFGANPKPPKPITDFIKANKTAFRDVLTHDRQLVYEIHDILKAYYNTSVQHYADSVCKNGLNQRFAEETLDVFSDSFVDALPDREVERIAAESIEDRRRRRKLKDEMGELEGVVAESDAILRESVGNQYS